MNPDIQILNRQPESDHFTVTADLLPEGSLLCGRHMVLRLKCDNPDSAPHFYMFGGPCNMNNPLALDGVIDLVTKTGLRITPLRCIYRAGKLHHVKLFIEFIENAQLEWLTDSSA